MTSARPDAARAARLLQRGADDRARHQPGGDGADEPDLARGRRRAGGKAYRDDKEVRAAATRGRGQGRRPPPPGRGRLPGRQAAPRTGCGRSSAPCATCSPTPVEEIVPVPGRVDPVRARGHPDRTRRARRDAGRAARTRRRPGAAARRRGAVRAARARGGAGMTDEDLRARATGRRRRQGDPGDLDGPLRPTARRARELLQAAADAYAGDPLVATELRGLLERFERPLTVGFAGLIKSGKSTLLNALVGARVAASDLSECTQTVTWYRYGETPRVAVHPRSGRSWESPAMAGRTGLQVDLRGSARGRDRPRRRVVARAGAARAHAHRHPGARRPLRGRVAPLARVPHDGRGDVGRRRRRLPGAPGPARRRALPRGPRAAARRRFRSPARSPWWPAPTRSVPAGSTPWCPPSASPGATARTRT